MDAFPTFPLFRDPVGERSFKPSDKPCDCCGRARGWEYSLRLYRAGRDELVLCPWCVADGSAAAKFGGMFNNCRGELDAADRDMVTRHTPKVCTWQDHDWVQCCGRPCIYIGEADAEDFAPGGRWAAAVPQIFGDLPGWSDEDRDGLICAIHRGHCPSAYVFECQVCHALTGYWDST